MQEKFIFPSLTVKCMCLLSVGGFFSLHCLETQVSSTSRVHHPLRVVFLNFSWSLESPWNFKNWYYTWFPPWDANWLLVWPSCWDFSFIASGDSNGQRRLRITPTSWRPLLLSIQWGNKQRRGCVYFRKASAHVWWTLLLLTFHWQE